MSYIHFEKDQLINLEYSLSREILHTNRAGSYASTTIVGCNTRKYHGLLVTLQPKIDNLHHVFLSTLDVSVIQRDAVFNLGIHKYAGNIYEPGGHKYLRTYDAEPVSKLTYRIGGAVLTSELIFSEDEDRLLIRYTLVEAHSPTRLKFRPMLAFRNVHFPMKANGSAATAVEPVSNGIRARMYDNYPWLYMQFSRDPEYHHNPDWVYGVEYSKEMTRGYEYQEDLFNPGSFEVAMEKGESIVFSAGFRELKEGEAENMFLKGLSVRQPRDSFLNCLRHAASQFFILRNGIRDMIAGYHWFSTHARDVFASLPGLTLTTGRNEWFFKTIDSLIERMKGPFFPSDQEGDKWVYYDVDGSLWFFWALDQYIRMTGDREGIVKKYLPVMRTILNAYRDGTEHHIRMSDNGLLWAGDENDSLTWMNTRVNNQPVIHRHGWAVEVNALWYNAVRFYSSLLDESEWKDEQAAWEEIAKQIQSGFIGNFWDETRGYLADVVRSDDEKDYTLRPNQVIACSIPYPLLPEETVYQILQKVTQELLTPRGLRTLSPGHPDYKGRYRGNIHERELAYHQGSAFPWLLGHFAEAYLRLHGKSGEPLIRKLLNGFEDEMTNGGLGTVSELYHGSPPHTGKGAISQAWSVAELLRINYLLNQLKAD
ncbi:MAG: glycogen debranching enzyme N-terminal domain-containing protein [Bacteroidales bacterium]